jgi:hypothetical protein
MQTMQDDLHQHGLRNHMRSRYLDDVAITALASAAQDTGAHCQIEVLRLGGALGRVPVDATAFAGRDGAYIANIVAAWTDPAASKDACARATYAALGPVGSGSPGT